MNSSLMIYCDLVGYINNRFTKEINKRVYDSIVWNDDLQKNLAYLRSMKDNRIFQEALNYCEANSIKNLHFSWLMNFEYLLAELKVRKNLSTKISFLTDWRLSTISEARANTFRELLEIDCIDKAMMTSIAKNFHKPSENLKQYFTSNKIVKIFVPFPSKNFKPYKEKSNMFNIPKDRFTILFFGIMNYGKGLDLLTDTMDQLKEHKITLIVCSPESSRNYEFDTKKLNKENILWRDSFTKEEEIEEIYNSVDCVALPYRKTYKEAGSYVLLESSMCHKPIIMPDIHPFNNEFVKSFKLGEYFESEDCESLKKVILKVYENYQEIKNNAKFDDFISNFISWEDYIKIFKEE